VIGSGRTVIYDGGRLARQGDVVVVTINYRLGALGFAHLGLTGAPGLEDAANLGIQDQIAALRFVREHIAAFGGDPDNVTVFGESAGAMSVGTLLGAPSARPLFRRAILQSGAAHNVSSRDGGARAAEAFLRELGATPATARKALENASVAAILAAQQRASVALGLAHGTLPWQPAVDGRVVPRQPLAAIAAGELRDVPILAGTNRDEWKLFTLFDAKTRRIDAAGVRRRLARILPETGADEAFELYRKSTEGAGPLALWEAIQADRIFRYPASRLAELQSAHQPATYKYLFDWTPRVGRDRIGACHALEIPFVFGTIAHPAMRLLLGATSGAQALSRTMREAWLSFARTGEPVSASLGKWAPYEGSERNTMRIGRRFEVLRAPLDGLRSFWHPHLAEPGV
jgi:para-nitrobenzyl esterase